MANFPNDARETARRQGEKDADRGMSREDCPYLKTSALHAHWCEGFDRRQANQVKFAKPKNWAH
jgi:ribosome modulation factor